MSSPWDIVSARGFPSPFLDLDLDRRPGRFLRNAKIRTQPVFKYDEVSAASNFATLLPVPSFSLGSGLGQLLYHSPLVYHFGSGTSSNAVQGLSGAPRIRQRLGRLAKALTVEDGMITPISELYIDALNAVSTVDIFAVGETGRTLINSKIKLVSTDGLYERPSLDTPKGVIPNSAFPNVEISTQKHVVDTDGGIWSLESDTASFGPLAATGLDVIYTSMTLRIGYVRGLFVRTMVFGDGNRYAFTDDSGATWSIDSTIPEGTFEVLVTDMVEYEFLDNIETIDGEFFTVDSGAGYFGREASTGQLLIVGKQLGKLYFKAFGYISGSPPISVDKLGWTLIPGTRPRDFSAIKLSVPSAPAAEGFTAKGYNLPTQSWRILVAAYDNGIVEVRAFPNTLVPLPPDNDCLTKSIFRSKIAYDNPHTFLADTPSWITLLGTVDNDPVVDIQIMQGAFNTTSPEDTNGYTVSLLKQSGKLYRVQMIADISLDFGKTAAECSGVGVDFVPGFGGSGGITVILQETIDPSGNINVDGTGTDSGELLRLFINRETVSGSAREEPIDDRTHYAVLDTKDFDEVICGQRHGGLSTDGQSIRYTNSTRSTQTSERWYDNRVFDNVGVAESLNVVKKDANHFMLSLGLGNLSIGRIGSHVISMPTPTAPYRTITSTSYARKGSTKFPKYGYVMAFTSNGKFTKMDIVDLILPSKLVKINGRPTRRYQREKVVNIFPPGFDKTEISYITVDITSFGDIGIYLYKSKDIGSTSIINDPFRVLSSTKDPYGMFGSHVPRHQQLTLVNSLEGRLLPDGKLGALGVPPPGNDLDKDRLVLGDGKINHLTGEFEDVLIDIAYFKDGLDKSDMFEQNFNIPPGSLNQAAITEHFAVIIGDYKGTRAIQIVS